MGLMTMARDHRQANGQFKEEPGNDSVSFPLHFLRKSNKTLAHTSISVRGMSTR